MTTRSIICLFDGTREETSALATAIALAKAYAASLKIVFVSYTATAYVGAFGEGVAVGAGWQEAIERETAQRLEAARRTVEELCAAQQLSMDDDAVAFPRATFVTLENVSNRDLVARLSLCDLIVIGAERGTDVVARSVPDLALFSTGRPVLVVRPRLDESAATIDGAVCGIAWNGSPQAVRAVLNALPLIVRARQTHLFVAGEAGRDGATTDPSAAAEYLAAHGVEAQAEAVAVEDGPAAEAVLTRARALGCDYLVMGAYGHSVFREMVLGGFTRHMLQHAEMSLLLSH